METENNHEALPQIDFSACEELLVKRARDDFLFFMRSLTIPSANGPCLFNDCISTFQLESFEELAPSLHAIRDGLRPIKRRFWIERTKKSAKDADLAICILWLMAFPQRPFLCQVIAADKEQAGIIKTRAHDLVFYNSWLRQHVSIVTNRIASLEGMAVTKIEATEEAGAHGPTPDLLILNELVHVKRWKVMDIAMNNADGVPRGVVVVSTNAGFKGTPAAKWRQNALDNTKRWTVNIWDKPSPWLLQQDLEDAKRRNLQSEYERLFWGKWCSGTGTALSEDIIEGCFREGLHQIEKPLDGWDYIAGLDLGISHDHAALVIVGVNHAQEKIRVANIKAWTPLESTGEVDLIDVENTCRRMSSVFLLSWLGYDPTEARLMGQRLVKSGIPANQVSFASPSNMKGMAEALIQCCNGKKLECYEDPEGRLRRDLGKFSIIHRAQSYRLEALRDEWGHADVGTALVICLLKAVEMLGITFENYNDVDVVYGTDDEGKEIAEPTQKDLEEWPEDLREIYEM